MLYTANQLETISQHFNLFTEQDADGNVVGNTSPDAETGWRPIYREQCLEALQRNEQSTTERGVSIDRVTAEIARSVGL
jgi:hypothetical protein